MILLSVPLVLPINIFNATFQLLAFSEFYDCVHHCVSTFGLKNELDEIARMVMM